MSGTIKKTEINPAGWAVLLRGPDSDIRGEKAGVEAKP